ncbi:uncharacterized protein LOC133232809 isoform X2 [Bos javanicus]|uniref:uncharacterized protein LOC133232809 isoform X2 n=1 Tax=Bos javanicus TaxID=9906 RepID=UPI002AA62ECF|nr:uncharacterized protein LOC133232809 isoform X2 [Bos javanicus]
MKTTENPSRKGFSIGCSSRGVSSRNLKSVFKMVESCCHPPWFEELQATAAELLGVERTLFVPTNTMANLISVMCHCRRRGSQLLLGHECHLHVYEQGGVAQIAGVHSHPLPDLPHGTLDLAELERLVTRGLGSPYHPVCELICLENTHSSSGGRVLPMEYLRQVHLLARRYGVRVHLDGARLMNAAVALGVPPACIVEHCDSVSLCFSKGLGAPVGALVGGPKDFIEEAWRLRKALGGGMRQAGVLAAAALVGLADAEEMLQRDHQNAQRFARGHGAGTGKGGIRAEDPADGVTDPVPWLGWMEVMRAADPACCCVWDGGPSVPGQVGHPPQPGGHESISGTSRRKDERTRKGTPASGGLVGGWGFTLQSSDLLNNKFTF